MSSLLILLVSCVHYTHYTPDPERDIELWLNTFGQQQSFSYHYRVQTKSVYSEARGNCVIGRGEHVKGDWHYADTKLAFEYVGLGDIEYMKQDGTWKETPRGEESDILAQIKRLLQFDKFEYKGLLDGYVYQFKANIPFLAPDRWKELMGVIQISPRHYLPEFIWAGLPDSSVYWEARLFNYNKVKRIGAPIRNWNTYLVSVDTMHDTHGLRSAIKRRLDLAGADYRTKKTDEGIMLTLPKEYSSEDVETMLAPGLVNVYSLTDNKHDATRVGYLGDDITRPLFLKTKLFDENDIKSVSIKFDGVSRPYMLISLHRKFRFPAEIAFEVNRVFVGTAALDIHDKVDKIKLYLDMSYYEMSIIAACVAQQLPPLTIKKTMTEKN
ncbi:MAG: hypothetical protein JSV97_01980 [candidate division WOR-3 bacterium]|nr:MAG: hypothetical protein JSV97_01980 [candidate division WOR-3 bacterium]